MKEKESYKNNTKTDYRGYVFVPKLDIYDILEKPRKRRHYQASEDSIG
jgi:hypothetical protein